MKKKIMADNMNSDDGYIEICEMCEIGIGNTEYNDGFWKHIEHRTRKLFNYDLCDTCYEKYFGKRRYFQQKVKQKIRETTNSYAQNWKRD